MSKLISSATRIVLIMFSLVLSASTITIIIVNINNEQVIEGILSLFNYAVVSVIAFYFGQKNIPTDKPEETQDMVNYESKNTP